MQQFYNMVDSILVGRFLGVNALAAVGATGASFFLIIGFSEGFSRGLSIRTSRYVGMGDKDKIRQSIAMSIVLSMLVGIFLSVLGVCVSRTLLQLLDVPAEIMEDAVRYIRIIYGGICITTAYNMISNISKALGDSVTPLIALAFSTVLNILLDYLLIGILPLGVAGASFATLLAQMASAILCLGFCLHKYEEMRLVRSDFKCVREEISAHLQQAFPMALQSSVVSMGVMVVSWTLNSFGTEAIAGYTAANRIDGLIGQSFVALGVSIATFCGQNMGANQQERILRGLRSGMKIMMILTVAGAVFNLTVGKWMVTLFTEESEVLAMARMHLTIISVFYPVFGVLIVLRNGLQGIGETVIPMISGFFELAARALSALFFARIIGFAGVCTANPSAWILSLFMIVIICRKEKIIQKRLSTE